MGKKDPRVDAYIGKSADFARPILSEIRSVVHDACPDVEETMKWSTPTFMYKGMLCGMAAFKKHCAFGFWHGEMRTMLQSEKSDEGAGHFGRLTSVDDLPSKATLMRLVKQAKKLNETMGKAPRKPASRKKRPPMKMPPDLLAALAKNKKAHQTFTAFSPSHQREYVEWITEAKREETRQKRLQTAIEWLAEGKSRHWKYQ